ncbi:chromosomal replication initiator DnaA [Thalassobius vesicularis]|uniref:Chromosomal replication initiator DnaA n=1 Tax=Thalassobius vesicularis TaxID=1294297 RepID=A0A4S3MB19_9RHOB|nr:DnaA/Hda family protein [Thalassobius vesicularis]THD75803.1 chromosomal replication initiator DnaA [Thalassobius vesicularis]
MIGQLSFDLPVRPALGREAFFVSPANAMAVVMIENWDQWAGRKLALIGPSGAGKTHLAHVWAAASGARIVSARDLPDADIPDLARGPIAVEDIPDIAGDRTAEEALFHLHNLVLAEGHHLLVTADRPVLTWGLTLPDLLSRMQGTQSVTLQQPDDQLLTAVVAKMFGDRQLLPSPETIAYMVTHMDRSFDVARALVADIDRAALELKRPVTRTLAVEVLKGNAPLGRLDIPDT